MKTPSDKVKFFFSHYAMEYLISKGWDLEQDMHEFSKTIDMNSVAFSIGEHEITEETVLAISRGEVINNGDKLLEKLQYIAEHNKDQPEGVIMQSMHSGSSDMLFVKDFL